MNGSLTTEAAAQLFEGINLVLSRWTALRMAVENEWGGPDSLSKSQNLGNDIFLLLTQSREKVYIDDVEDMLDNFMLSLYTEVEDGSIGEIAEKMMVMHEECCEGNFDSIRKLRETNAPTLSYVAQPSQSNEEDSDEVNDTAILDTENAMEVDDQPSAGAEETMKNTAGTRSIPQQPADDDGWSVVTSKRNKGRKSNFAPLINLQCICSKLCVLESKLQ